MRHYTIKTEDVGVPFLRAFGSAWPVSGFLGRILAGDVGKRVYLCGGILLIENDEQRAARIACCDPTTPAKTDRLCQALHNHNPDDFEAISTPIMGATRCECPTGCGMIAVLHLYRVTAYLHETPIYDTLPVDFCEPCGGDALESGLYGVGDDQLEPHHGPDCIKRMLADNEGGQS